MASLLSPTPVHRPWRDSPPARVFWAFFSWALFTTSMSLLIASSFVVLALGGSCANGGPYEIRVECPANVAVFTPASIFGGLAAVGVSWLLARGFALPLVGWAWTILFVGLSVPFFMASASGDLTGVVVGTVFAVMGLGLPLGLLQQGRFGYFIVGSTDVRGRSFTREAPPRSAGADGTVPPRSGTTAADVVLALLVPTAGIGVGLAMARLLWLAAV